MVKRKDDLISCRDCKKLERGMAVADSFYPLCHSCLVKKAIELVCKFDLLELIQIIESDSDEYEIYNCSWHTGGLVGCIVANGALSEARKLTGNKKLYIYDESHGDSMGDLVLCEHHNNLIKNTQKYWELISGFKYKDYLSSDAWKEKAKVCKEKSENKCQVCNKYGKLNAHHRTYERLGNELPMDLIALCGSCHKLFHNNLKLH